MFYLSSYLSIFFNYYYFWLGIFQKQVSCYVVSFALFSQNTVVIYFFVLSRATILVELEMDGNTEPLNFVPGDHVGIFPGNSPELVAGILKHLPNAPPINQSLRLEFLSAYPGTEHLTVPNYIMEVLHKIA